MSSFGVLKQNRQTFSKSYLQTDLLSLKFAHRPFYSMTKLREKRIVMR